MAEQSGPGFFEKLENHSSSARKASQTTSISGDSKKMPAGDTYKPFGSWFWSLLRLDICPLQVLFLAACVAGYNNANPGSPLTGEMLPSGGIVAVYLLMSWRIAGLKTAVDTLTKRLDQLQANSDGQREDYPGRSCGPARKRVDIDQAALNSPSNTKLGHYTESTWRPFVRLPRPFPRLRHAPPQFQQRNRPSRVL